MAENSSNAEKAQAAAPVKTTAEAAVENTLQEIFNDAGNLPLDYNKHVESPGGGE